MDEVLWKGTVCFMECELVAGSRGGLRLVGHAESWAITPAMVSYWERMKYRQTLVKVARKYWMERSRRKGKRRVSKGVRRYRSDTRRYRDGGT
jgi:hypothetical protein